MRPEGRQLSRKDPSRFLYGPACPPIKWVKAGQSQSHLWMIVEVEMGIGSVLLQEEELLFPLPDLLLLLEQISLHFDALLPLGVRLLAALAKSGIDLLRSRLFRLLGASGKGAIVLTGLLKRRKRKDIVNNNNDGDYFVISSLFRHIAALFFLSHPFGI